MTENNELLNALRFRTVDGQYLQDNDVEHENFVLIEDLQDWFKLHTGVLVPTQSDIMELAMSGGHARRNYYNSDKFVEVPDVINAMAEITTGIVVPPNDADDQPAYAVGDIVTFTERERLFKTQEMAEITRINEGFVFTKGNICPSPVQKVILVCRKAYRQDQ